MQFQKDIHTIDLDGFLKPFDAKLLPEETTAAFLADARAFPIGTSAMCTEPDSLDTPLLLYDSKRDAFYAATINILLDLYAAHLDAEDHDSVPDI